MKNRSDIIREYFDLIVYLNRSNAAKNEKTEIVFEIRRSANSKSFGCYLKGANNPTFLVLCKQTTSSHWKISNHTNFFVLEEYCMNLLNLHGDLASIVISEGLRSLVIKK